MEAVQAAAAATKTMFVEDSDMHRLLFVCGTALLEGIVTEN